MYQERADLRQDYRHERDELEPVLDDDSFIFLDDRRRPFKVATRRGVWWLYYQHPSHWKPLRPLNPAELLRAQRRALPRGLESLFDPSPQRR